MGTVEPNYLPTGDHSKHNCNHCWCGTTIVNMKKHRTCCKCGDRKLAVGEPYWKHGESWNTDQSTSDENVESRVTH